MLKYEFFNLCEQQKITYCGPKKVVFYPHIKYRIHHLIAKSKWTFGRMYYKKNNSTICISFDMINLLFDSTF